jgi:hypothetical protein
MCMAVLKRQPTRPETKSGLACSDLNEARRVRRARRRMTSALSKMFLVRNLWNSFDFLSGYAIGAETISAPHDLRGAVRLVFAQDVVRGSPEQTQNSRRESQTGSRETGKVLQPPTLGQFYTEKAEQRVMVRVYNQPFISLT